MTPRCLIVLLVGAGLAGPATAAPAPPVQPSTLALVIEEAFSIPAATPRMNAIRSAQDGSGRLFVVALEGPLYVVEGGVASVYLDVGAIVGADFKTAPGLSSGLVSVAFHPEFASNGRFFTVHSEVGTATGAAHAPVQDPPSIFAEGTGPVASTYQHSVLTEWTAADPAASVFAGSSRELMRLGAPGHQHPMGEIAFDPTQAPDEDGYGLLTIGVGDGMSYTLGYAGNDAGKPNNVQRLDSLLGTILRIDPDGSDGVDGRYGIPPDNPFTLLGAPGVRAEIYAYGFRNPHRLTWDATTGALYIADIGQAAIEEIDRVRPGDNHGWAEREGPFLVGGGALDPDILSGAADDGFEYPVAIYDHDEGTAIAGVLALRDGAPPSLAGRLFSGDISTGRVFVASIAALEGADDGAPVTTATVYEPLLLDEGVPRTLLEIINDNRPSSRADLRLGQGADGTVYILNKRDGVVRILRQRNCPADLTLDAVVDGADLGVLLAAWGPGDPGADLNGDGVIDGADLGLLLSAWGACAASP